MISSTKKVLIGILVACVLIILTGCEPEQSFGKYTIRNTSSYPACFFEHFWDDGDTVILPGEEKTETEWWLFEDEYGVGFKYTINEEVVENYDILLHHKEHVTVIIKEPGPDGYEILRETNIEL